MNVALFVPHPVAHIIEQMGEARSRLNLSVVQLYIVLFMNDCRIFLIRIYKFL